MTEGDPPPSNDFEARLHALRKRVSQDRDDSGGPARVPQSAVGFAMRAGIELVAGVVVGGGIGWLLDAWLETGPFLFVLFFFLGAGAGVTNVIRIARQMSQADSEEGR